MLPPDAPLPEPSNLEATSSSSDIDDRPESVKYNSLYETKEQDKDDEHLLWHQRLHPRLLPSFARRAPSSRPPPAPRIRHLARPSLASCIAAAAALLILATLARLHFFHRPNTTYDRSHDSELAHFVYASRAARALPRRGSLFCWVMTSPVYHDTRARAVNETWLRRCDHGQFFTSDHFRGEKLDDEGDVEAHYAASSRHGIKELPLAGPGTNVSSSFVPYSTVFAGIPDSYDHLFFKSRFAFYYIYAKMRVDFDWYLKADDDSYIIVENLRKYLATLDPSKPYFLGFRLKKYLPHGYNGGGAGYVLSRAALHAFATRAFPNEEACPDDRFEDVGIARCLASLGIFPHRTVNERGQQRFNTHTPDEVFQGFDGADEWIVDAEVKGMDGIPDDLISFHHLPPNQIRLFDVLLYRVKVHNSSSTVAPK